MAKTLKKTTKASQVREIFRTIPKTQLKSKSIKDLRSLVGKIGVKDTDIYRIRKEFILTKHKKRGVKKTSSTINSQGINQKSIAATLNIKNLMENESLSINDCRKILDIIEQMS